MLHVNYNQRTAHILGSWFDPFLFMLHQRYKDIAFWGIAKATLPNYWVRRYLLPKRLNGATHLHLGCGTKYLPGFVNVDGNLFSRIDLWLDVRNGLPFPPSSIDSIYSTHMSISIRMNFAACLRNVFVC